MNSNPNTGKRFSQPLKVLPRPVPVYSHGLWAYPDDCEVSAEAYRGTYDYSTDDYTGGKIPRMNEEEN